MTHVSLYRKWRPPTFEQLVGQEHVARTLINAIKRDEVAHAYLFTGPRGTGKTSTAKVLAKAINCAEGPSPDPCGRCENCMQIAQGNSLDVLEIDAASNRGIEEIRELRERIAFAPVSGRKKVYIIDEVHMLTTEASNALLKTLEEPPDHVVFVLATTEAHKVLPTILSRCQRFDFRRLAVTELVGRLKAIAQAEKIAIDDEALSLLARQSDGSLRDAISALDQLGAYTGNKVTTADVAELFGLIEADLLFQAVDLLASGEAGALFGLVDEVISTGRDAPHFLTELLAHVRNLFVLHNVGDDAASLINGGPDYLAALKQQADRLDAGTARRILGELGELQLAIRQAGDGRLALEIGLVRAAGGLRAVDSVRITDAAEITMAAPVAPAADTKAPEEQRAQPDRARTKTSKKQVEMAKPAQVVDEPQPPADESPTPALETAEPAAQAAGKLSLPRVKAAWPAALDIVRKNWRSMLVFLLEARPSALSGSTLTVSFTGEYFKSEMEKPENARRLQQALCGVLGTTVDVVYELTTAGGAPPPARPDAPEPAKTAAKEAPADDESGSDDLVDMLQRDLGAEVIEEVTHD